MLKRTTTTLRKAKSKDTERDAGSSGLRRSSTRFDKAGTTLDARDESGKKRRKMLLRDDTATHVEKIKSLDWYDVEARIKRIVI